MELSTIEFTIHSANIIWVLTFLVSTIFVLRIVGKKYKKNCWINKLNRVLRKKHIPLGVGLIIVSLLHGICAYIGIPYVSLTLTILNFTGGIVCLIFLVLLCGSYVLRKKIKPYWMFWHRVLAIVFFIVFVWHVVVEVPVIQEEAHQNISIIQEKHTSFLTILGITSSVPKINSFSYGLPFVA
ncbi:MAG: hypothetical protein P4L59_14075 [Desulfosporosinus sp.]|nr:hypothetical protein [Desulfosporosinus sp.]